MDSSPGLDDAILLAVQAHHGRVDKAGRPYVLHVLRVMLMLGSDVERVVGVLHDVVEESDVTLDRLRMLGYSERVVEAS
jgi:(p)ppGpp synthase/HD superfamily hydrolase